MESLSPAEDIRRGDRRQVLLQVALGASCTATGAGLLAHFLMRMSLGVALAATIGLAVGAWVALWRHLAPPLRTAVVWRARIGLLAGALATAGYDLSRLLLVELSGSSVKPFEAWRAFGELLGAGPRITTAALAVGFAYHVANGLGFAAAYAIVLAERGVVAGVLWALALETLMVSFYPGWLGLKAFDEFISITVFGHLVYGVLLGWLARALVLRRRAPPLNR